MKIAGLLRSLLLGTAALAAPWFAAAGPALDWNEIAFKAVVTARQGPTQGVRTMAIVQTAVFDAVNAVEPRYQPFKFSGTPPAGASADAAAAAAAHTVLVKLFPDQRAGFDEALAKALAAAPEGAARDGGRALGLAVADTLLAWCADDRVGAPTQYRPTTQPGVYVMTTLPVGDDVAASRPWVLKSGDQFRPGPPPALAGEVWARDYAESVAVGARTGSTRTQENTEVANFWVVTGAPAFNGVIRQAVAPRKLSTVAEARLLALTYMAFNDALVAVFDAKYTYNFWRPITAVRNGDLHGNVVIKRAPGWLPLVDAPLHPEYPCAHCISAATVVAVLRSEMNDDVPTITMTSPTAPGVTRKWNKLSEVEQEVSDARIWSGVHYRNSTEVGRRMGRQVADYALKTQLQPK